MKLLINDKVVDIEIADTFFKRLTGLMFKKDYDKAMLFKNTTVIHTFGMKFNIDVIYLDENFSVLKIIYNINPNKILLPIKGSKHVVEIKQRLKSDDLITIKAS